MSVSTLSSIERTIEKTHVWLNEIDERLGWKNTQRSYQALRAVLHALRDRLTVEEAADLSAQLPLLIRGVFFEGWHPSGKPVKERKREEFLAHVRDAFVNGFDVDPEAVTRCVFQTLAAHVSGGEIDDIKRMLPEKLRDLWSADS